MPIEFSQLKDKPVPLTHCPNCGDRPFRPFLRGLIQRPMRKWWGFGQRQDYCCLICWNCKAIVDYEAP